MRDIKFRAWNNKEKMMRGINLDLFPLKGRISSQVFCKEFEIILQFTGLKDKNDVDIYEGDICIVDIKVDGIWKSQTGEICYEFGAFFVAGPQHMIYLFHVADISEGLEESEYLNVIGNIYENPELLK